MKGCLFSLKKRHVSSKASSKGRTPDYNHVRKHSPIYQVHSQIDKGKNIHRNVHVKLESYSEYQVTMLPTRVHLGFYLFLNIFILVYVYISLYVYILISLCRTYIVTVIYLLHFWHQPFSGTWFFSSKNCKLRFTVSHIRNFRTLAIRGSLSNVHVTDILRGSGHRSG